MTGETAQEANPYRGFRFRVTIGFDSGGPPHGGFSEVSGLWLKAGAMEYREGDANGNDVLKLTAIGNAPDIILKRGMMARDSLYPWLEAAKNGGNDAAKIIRIDLMADDGASRVASWTLVDARPVKVAGPSLDAAAIEVAIEELVLAAEAVERA